MIKRAFSLMEMLIVMLIVAIVAAASAPMISKKMLQDSAGDSPWVWTGADNSIAYNMKGSETSAVIGSIKSPNKAKLYIESDTTPQLALAKKGETPVNMYVNNGTIHISDTNIGGASKSVALGCGASIQNSAKAVAIGYGAKAEHNNSTAVGAGAVADGENVVMLGTSADTVKIPNKATVSNDLTVNGKTVLNGDVEIKGKLIVRGETVLGYDKKPVYAYMTQPNGTDDGVFRLFRSWNANEITGNRFDMIILENETYSDRRLKNVGEEFKGGLEEVKKLQVFNYTYKKDKNKTPRVGVIAQDLEKVFPNAVFKGDDGFLRIRLEEILYSVVNAVKQLDVKTENLVVQVKTIITDITDLKTKVVKQEKIISELVEQNKAQQKIITDLEKRVSRLEKK